MVERSDIYSVVDMLEGNGTYSTRVIEFSKNEYVHEK